MSDSLSGDVKLYINGTLEDELTQLKLDAIMQPMSYMQFSNTSSQKIVGQMDEFYYFKEYALTSTDVTALNNGGKGAFWSPATGGGGSHWSANSGTLDLLDSHMPVVYKFESGALTTDSKGSNNLTASATPPTSVIGGMDGNCVNFARTLPGQSMWLNTSGDFNSPNKFSISTWLKWMPLGTGIWVQSTGSLIWSIEISSNRIRFTIVTGIDLYAVEGDYISA